MNLRDTASEQTPPPSPIDIDRLPDVPPQPAVVPPRTIPSNDDISLSDTASVQTRTPSPIDVDRLPDFPRQPEAVLQIPVSKDDTHPCEGIPVNLPPGISSHTAYPFGLHDKMGDPWDYSVKQGSLVLRARCCRHVTTGGSSKQCHSCRSLTESPLLGGILERLEKGVHENSQMMYHGVGGLIKIVRQKNGHIQALRLRKLNEAKKLMSKTVALEKHKEWMMAIGSGKVERIDRLVRAGISRKVGIRGMLNMYDRAAQKVYRTQNYTEEDALRGLLFWRLGGARVAGIAHKALGLPSLSTLRRQTVVAPIITSPGQPTRQEVQQNVWASLESIAEVVEGLGIVHQVLMLDELKVEERPRWDDKTNMILGPCREHGGNTSLEFNSRYEAQLLIEALRVGDVHLSVEVCVYLFNFLFCRPHVIWQGTVGALGILSAESQVYSARPILISGSCKRETGSEHARLIRTTLEGIHTTKPKLRTICIASDGESRRGEALIIETSKHTLDPSSPIFRYLHMLPFMNLKVGDEDITADKDYKHVFKRLRNLMLHQRGFLVHGIHITPTVIKSHLRSNSLSSVRVDNLLKPEDKQDVKLAYDLLREIWSLPPASADTRPGFASTREAFRMLGTLVRHILIPYICVDLSLSEQLSHLSAAAFLLLALWQEERTGMKLMPTQLYLDIMHMIKNVYFCVVKCKADNPTGEFWIILLGTDRLEELFGILRTMVGNDTNLDLLQLSLRLTGTTEVSTILAKYPQWDRAPRRLNLPALSKDGLHIHSGVDHIKPASWRGNVKVANVNLQSCWKLGRQMIKSEVPQLAQVYKELDIARSSEAPPDLMSPLGKDLIHGQRDADDYDDSAEDFDSSVVSSAPPPGPDLEDAIAEESGAKHDPCFELDGDKVYKARYLNQLFADFKTPGSRDRLKRVANIPRYAVKRNIASDIVDQDSASGTPSIRIDSPIVTLVKCEDHIFLCIGEVNDITFDSSHLEELSIETLTEPSTFVSFQLLILVPATTDDDPGLKHDWRWTGKRSESHRASGRLVEPINPAVCTRNAGSPFYLFESSVLMAIGSTIFERICPDDRHLLPTLRRSDVFPYREESG